MTFETGTLVQTSGIAHEIKEDSKFAMQVYASLNRYVQGDWGDLCDDDKELNNQAVKSNDDRILAAYNLNTTEGTRKVYIITEWDRSLTTILFADEY